MVVVLSLLAGPALAHPVPVDTSASCPASTPNAGFADIGTLDATTRTAINCLAAFGIAQGTTAETYSPNANVARWQMALLLIRQAEDHGLSVPAPIDQGFTDISGQAAATRDAINQVAQMGISSGTTSTTFSPNEIVTRSQMALFLYRLAVRAGVTVTDDPTSDSFSDIGAYGSEIQNAITFLADGHIALGTSEGIFSGNINVTRWQMALFITRVLAADGITQ